MVYRGTIKNGQVVVETSAKLPEGASVRIEVENPAAANGAPPSDSLNLKNFWTAMRGMAGKAQTLPSDIAENHDHYLYGRPRK